MRKLVILACLCAGMARSQTTPSSLLVTRIFNITSTWPGECAAGVIDNRSMFTRQNNYHSFFATGTGTWSVTMQFSDVSCSGPFTSYGPQAVVNQGSGLAIGYGNDLATSYHQFITFVFSGANANTVQVTYSAVQNFFLSTTAGSLTFPIVVSQGGTGFSTCTANGFIYGNGTSPLQCLAAGSQYQVAQAGAAGVPTMGPLQLAQSAAITGNLPSANGGTGASSPAAHTVAVAEGSSPFTFAGPGTSGQPLVSGGAAADPAYQNLTVPGGGTGITTATVHGVLLGEGASAFGVTAAGASGQPLVSGGVSADPTYQTLGVPGGGTGVTTATAHGVAIGETTSPLSFTSAGSSGQPLVSNGAAADPTYQTLPVGGGGTGLTTVTANGIPYGNGASALNVTAAGSQFQTLQAGLGGTPAFGAVALNQSVAISGVLPVTNGGIGVASPAAHTVAVAEGSSAFTFAGPGTSGQPLVSNGASADPTYQTLPVGGGGTGVTNGTAHTVTIAEGSSPFAFAGPGTSGQPLVSNGAAADPTYQTLPVSGGGTGVITATAHGVLLGEAASPFGVTGTGTSGQPLVSNGAAADPTYQTLPVGGGGTGLTTATAHGVVVGEGTSALSVTTAGVSGQPLVSNGAAADPTYQTLPVSGGGTGVATATVHGVAIGETTSPLNFTSAGTSGQVLTSNGAGADPTFQAAAASLPAGTQLQYLRIQPNTGNNTTTQFAALWGVNVNDYNYPAQTPGGTLTGGGGAQNITLTPCPVGIVVSGTFATPVYISGGTGVAESLRPTAGTCTSGGATGTITVSPINNHSGAWTVQSSTVGIMEAIAANPKREIHIPFGTYNLTDCIVLDSSKPLVMSGDGYDPSGVTGTQLNFSTISVFSSACNGAAISDFDSVGYPINPITIRNLLVVGNGSTGPVVNGIGLSKVTRVSLDNIMVSGFAGNCVALSNAFEIYIDNRSYFQLCGNYGLNASGTSNLVSIKDSSFGFNSRANGNGNITIIGTSGANNQSTAVYLQGVDVENAGQNPYTTVTVAWGLFIDNVASVSVIGCFFEGNVGGSPSTQVQYGNGVSSITEIGNTFNATGTSATVVDYYSASTVSITSFSNTFYGANATRFLTASNFGGYVLGPDTCLSSSTECTTHFRSLGAGGTTGAGSAALGANSPAVTNTAPYTWLKLLSSDGSTVFVPAWK